MDKMKQSKKGKIMIVTTIPKLRALKGELQVKNAEITKELGWAESMDRYLSKLMNDNEYASPEQIQKIANAIITISKKKQQEIAA